MDENILNATSSEFFSTLAEIHVYLHIPTKKNIMKSIERVPHRTVLTSTGATWPKYPKFDAFNSAFEDE